jgi:tRNA(Met) C34 N-acetyltransferase TmcA
MTDNGKRALYGILREERSSNATLDDLQGLLLQVVFALLMIFIIAYFIFVTETKKERQEQILDLNRQKLVLALEKTEENKRMRYGLNALMTQGTDGKRIFNADDHVSGAKLRLAPAAKEAFSSGSAAAYADYSDGKKLLGKWYDEVIASADITQLTEAEKIWLEKEVSERVETVRLDVRGVQRALAARLQKSFIENPGELESISDANALAEAIKLRSLDMIREEICTEVLP